MNDNPFAAGPGEFITQDVKTCPICQREYTNAGYTVEVRYYNEAKNLDQVCPDCMKRLGFSEPKLVVSDRRYMNLVHDALSYRRMHEEGNGEK